MDLKKFCLHDGNFPHQRYTSPKIDSKFIQWDRGCSPDNQGPVFMVDGAMYYGSHLPGKKIGWLMEPRAISGHVYEWAKSNLDRFDTLLTFDRELLEWRPDKFKFYPFAGSWVEEKDHKIYEKTKLLSVIASGKNQTDGHRLRHTSINKLRSENLPFDAYGYGYRAVQDKIQALRDYAFTIVIENSKKDYYFTEKLIDAFVTGCVPIYWGCPSIGNFFNTKGMIIINDENELANIVKTLNFETYSNMLSHVKMNFEIAKNYLLAEDWIYKNTNLFV